MNSKIICSSRLEGIHRKVFNKILAPNIYCKDGEKVIAAWNYSGKFPQVGQVMGEKFLPNGNKQIRFTTVYADTARTVATDTRVYSPDGVLLNCYHGVRSANANIYDAMGNLQRIVPATSSYANTKNSVAELIKAESAWNDNIKFLPYC